MAPQPTRSLAPSTPALDAQCAQQKIRSSDSMPCPRMRQPQWSHVGATAWIAHSKESKTCVSPPTVSSIALSYSLPQTSQVAMSAAYPAMARLLSTALRLPADGAGDEGPRV